MSDFDIDAMIAQANGGKEADAPVPQIELVRTAADDWLAKIEPEKELLAGMVPCEAYTVIAGALSGGKSTLLHSLLIMRATGLNILNLPLPKIEEGPAVLVSYEDSERRIYRRLRIIVQGVHRWLLERAGDAAAAQFLEAMSDNLRHVTLTGKSGGQLVTHGRNGRPCRNDAMVDQIIDKVRAFAEREVLVGLDPLRLAFRGSQNDDDGADLVVEVLNYIPNALADSALMAATHTNKTVGQEGKSGDRSSAYATSGSALYSQHARSNFYVARPKEADLRKLFAAGVLTDKEVEKELVMELTHARLSYGTEGDKAYFAMRRGLLQPVVPTIEAKQTPKQKAQRWLDIIGAEIVATEQAGLRATKASLEGNTDLRDKLGSRNKVREALGTCIAQQWIEEQGSTTNKAMHLTEAGRARFDAQTVQNMADKEATEKRRAKVTGCAEQAAEGPK